MNGDLILIIPVLLIIVAIMFLVRHMRGGSDDSIKALIGIVPIVIIIGVAIGIIVSMASIADPWEWDADSKTLTIDGNIHDTGLSYPWTGYANQVETLVIEPGVEFIQGPAFAWMTNLEYVDIAEGVTLDDGAFSVTFEDPFGSAIDASGLAGYSFKGFGDGALYAADPQILKHTGTDIYTVTGFADGVTGVVNLVIPKSIDGHDVASIGANAFRSSSIERLLFESEDVSLSDSSFFNSASLEKVQLPDRMEVVALQSFRGCSSLETIVFPETVKEIAYQTFMTCTALDFTGFHEGLETLVDGAFNGCSSITKIHFPSTLDTIGSYAFNGCSGVTEISFANGFDPSTFNDQAFRSWTFYAADATTVIDKTVAANLAGKTFQGTAAALVEVIHGERSLTPDQVKKVQLHDVELERIRLEAISIDPLPFELQDA